jgi:hypothetical protein
VFRLSYACSRCGSPWASIEIRKGKDDCPLCGAIIEPETCEQLPEPMPLERFSLAWRFGFDGTEVIPDGQTVERLGARLSIVDGGSIGILDATWLDLPAALTRRPI